MGETFGCGKLLSLRRIRWGWKKPRRLAIQLNSLVRVSRRVGKLGWRKLSEHEVCEHNSSNSLWLGLRHTLLSDCTSLKCVRTHNSRARHILRLDIKQGEMHSVTLWERNRVNEKGCEWMFSLTQQFSHKGKKHWIVQLNEAGHRYVTSNTKCCKAISLSLSHPSKHIEWYAMSSVWDVRASTHKSERSTKAQPMY